MLSGFLLRFLIAGPFATGPLLRSSAADPEAWKSTSSSHSGGWACWKVRGRLRLILLSMELLGSSRSPKLCRCGRCGSRLSFPLRDNPLPAGLSQTGGILQPGAYLHLLNQEERLACFRHCLLADILDLLVIICPWYPKRSRSPLTKPNIASWNCRTWLSEPSIYAFVEYLRLDFALGLTCLLVRRWRRIGLKASWCRSTWPRCRWNLLQRSFHLEHTNQQCLCQTCAPLSDESLVR